MNFNFIHTHWAVIDVKESGVCWGTGLTVEEARSAARYVLGPLDELEDGAIEEMPCTSSFHEMVSSLNPLSLGMHSYPIVIDGVLGTMHEFNDMCEKIEAQERAIAEAKEIEDFLDKNNDKGQGIRL